MRPEPQEPALQAASAWFALVARTEFDTSFDTTSANANTISAGFDTSFDTTSISNNNTVGGGFDTSFEAAPTTSASNKLVPMSVSDSQKYDSIFESTDTDKDGMVTHTHISISISMISFPFHA